MLQLPALLADAGQWRPPWTNADARSAAAALLVADREPAIDDWLALLGRCPTLALWTICRDPAWKDNRPRSWRDVATRLADRAGEWLRDDVRPNAYSPQCVSAARALAHRFRRRAARRHDWLAEPPSGESPALADASAWLAVCESAQRDVAGELLPDWLFLECRAAGAASGWDVLRSLDAAPHWTGFPDPWLVDADPEAATLVRLAAATRQAESRRAASWSERLQNEKLASLRQLAYGASHELNNPLANISARAQMLLLDETDPQRRRKLEAINRQAYRAHEMIADMMLFANPPAPSIEPVRLHALFEEVVRGIQERAQAQQTKVTIECDASLEIQADPTHLAEALRALLLNALEALQAGGIVRLLAAGHQNNGSSQVVITVRDTGPGLSELDRRHLFDPYYSGREAGRGLGLGLSKTWRIVEQHGGRIEVASELNQGAEFRLYL